MSSPYPGIGWAMRLAFHKYVTEGAQHRISAYRPRPEELKGADLTSMARITLATHLLLSLMISSSAVKNLGHWCILSHPLVFFYLGTHCGDSGPGCKSNFFSYQLGRQAKFSQLGEKLGNMGQPTGLAFKSYVGYKRLRAFEGSQHHMFACRQRQKSWMEPASVLQQEEMKLGTAF